MISGLEKAWNALKNFKSIINVLDGISSDIYKLDNDKIAKTTKGLEMNSMENDAYQLSDFTIKANENDDKVQWQNMMIKGPSPYSNMRETFSNILIEHSKNFVTLTHSFYNGNCNLTIGNEGFDINAKEKIGILSILLSLGRKKAVGLKIDPNESVSLGAGVNFISNNSNTIWSATFRNPAAVLETNVESRNHKDSKVVKMNVSGVFGRNFGRFGILAGFDLAFSNPGEFNRRGICQAVSLGVVSPTTSGVLTIQPNNELLILENGWKIKNSLELATRSKAKYTSTLWNSRDHEVGLKYRHSEIEEYGVNADLAGNVTLRTCFYCPSVTWVFIAKTDIKQNFSYGISIEI